MGRSDFKPSPFTCICSLHFESECFSVTAKNKTLKKSALPTIFNQNFKNFLKRKQKRKKVTKAQPDKNFDLANEQESPEGIKCFKNAPSSPYRKCFAIPTAIHAGCVCYVSVSLSLQLIVQGTVYTVIIEIRLLAHYSMPRENCITRELYPEKGTMSLISQESYLSRILSQQ